MNPSALIAREAAVGAVINGVLSAGFAWALLGGSRTVTGSALAADAMPQSFAVAFMGMLVPTLLTRARLRRDSQTLGDRAFAAWLPSHALVRALSVAVPIALLSGAVQFALFAGQGPYDTSTVLVGKTLLGACLGALITMFAVRAALYD